MRGLIACLASQETSLNQEDTNLTPTLYVLALSKGSLLFLLGRSAYE